LVNRESCVPGSDESDSSSDMGSGHGSSGHGGVCVSSGVSAGDDGGSRGRDLRLQSVGWSRSSGRERGHGVSILGGSNGQDSGLISWRVGGSACSSRVSDGEDWDDVSGPPGIDDGVVEGVSGTTSP
jgi:hypothetical protein